MCPNFDVIKDDISLMHMFSKLCLASTLGLLVSGLGLGPAQAQYVSSPTTQAARSAPSVSAIRVTIPQARAPQHALEEEEDEEADNGEDDGDDDNDDVGVVWSAAKV